MLGHQKGLKSLGKAIAHGAKMAAERGIKRIAGGLFDFNDKGEVCGACALGMAQIAKHGTIGVRQFDLNWAKDFPDSFKVPKGACLRKTISNVTADKTGITESTDVLSFVFNLNDKADVAPEVIAEKLKSCQI